MPTDAERGSLTSRLTTYPEFTGEEGTLGRRDAEQQLADAIYDALEIGFQERTGRHLTVAQASELTGFHGLPAPPTKEYKDDLLDLYRTMRGELDPNE